MNASFVAMLIGIIINIKGLSLCFVKTIGLASIY